MKNNIIDRFLKTILRSRFEPIETVLAVSAILHGLWLIVPYWATQGAVEITPAPRMVELVIGGLLFVLGSIHLTSIITKWNKVRHQVAFAKFIMWFFFTWLAYVAVGPFSIIWVVYLTISLISAIVYLNIGVRDDVW